uniref:Uncharacterized protein n=1 Tax=Glossina pallidipes TaxID=7398 RepID=A0A1A9ZL66_GLOPL
MLVFFNQSRSQFGQCEGVVAVIDDLTTENPEQYSIVASNESNANTATGSGSGESTALFSKLRSFSIGSGPNSPQRVVSNLRGFLTTRLSNIAPGDTGIALGEEEEEYNTKIASRGRGICDANHISTRNGVPSSAMECVIHCCMEEFD